MKKILALALLCGLLTTPAFAQIIDINFDDLPVSASPQQIFGSKYDGFTFSSQFKTYISTSSPTFFGVNSAPNALLVNFNATSATMTSTTNIPFTLNSMYLAISQPSLVPSGNELMTIEGLSNGVVVDTQTVTVTDTPTQYSFGFANITQIHVAPGGASDITVDNINVNMAPEPSTVWLGIGGAFLLVVWRRRSLLRQS